MVHEAHTPFTPPSPGPVLRAMTLSPAPPTPTPPPTRSGVMSGSFGGLLTTGPDNQRVCKPSCDFQFFFERRIFLR